MLVDFRWSIFPATGTPIWAHLASYVTPIWDVLDVSCSSIYPCEVPPEDFLPCSEGSTCEPRGLYQYRWPLAVVSVVRGLAPAGSLVSEKTTFENTRPHRGVLQDSIRFTRRRCSDDSHYLEADTWFERVGEKWELNRIFQVDASGALESRTFAYDTAGNLELRATCWNNHPGCRVEELGYEWPAQLRGIYSLPSSSIVKGPDGGVLRAIEGSHHPSYPWLSTSVGGDVVPVELAYRDAGFVSPVGTAEELDPAGIWKPVQIRQVLAETGEEILTYFRYDVFGNLVETVPSGGPRATFTYRDSGLAAGVEQVPFAFLNTVVRHGRGSTEQQTVVHDSFGRVISQTSFRNHALSLVWDRLGRLEGVNDGEYDVEITYPALETSIKRQRTNDTSTPSEFLRLTSDTQGRLSHLQRTEVDPVSGEPRSFVRGWEYGLLGGVIRMFVTDPDTGAMEDLLRVEDTGTGRFDFMGRPRRVVGARGETYAYSHDDSLRDHGLGRFAARHATTVVQPSGQVAGEIVDYSDTLGLVIAHTDDVTTRFGWTGFGALQWRLSEDGDLTFHEYDSLGRRVRTIRTVQESWDGIPPVCEPTDAPDPDCIVDAWQYDSAHRVRDATGPRGFHTTYTYDGFGRLDIVTNPLHELIDVDFDPDGNLVSRCFRTACAQWQLDYRNLVVSHTDEAGETTLYGRDFFGRLNTREYKAAGTSEKWRYDVFGNVREYINERGAKYSWELDWRGAPIGSAEPRGPVADRRFVSNTAGDVLEVSVRNSAGDFEAAVQNEYDWQGRVLAAHLLQVGVVMEWRFNLRGLQTDQMVSPRDEHSTSGYDALGRLVTSASAEGRRQTWVYGVSGTPREHSWGDPTSPKSRWTYHADAAGNLRGVVNPLGGVTSYAYDSVGRLETVLEAGFSPTTIEYGDLASTGDQRLVHITDPRGFGSEIEQDLLGRTTKQTDASGFVEELAYGPRGWLDSTASYKSEAPAVRHVYSFTYTPTGLIETATVGDGIEAATTRWAYDLSDNLGFTEDPMGLVTEYSYDGPYPWATSVVARRYRQDFEYDQLGRVVQRTAQLSSGPATWISAYTDATRTVAVTVPQLAEAGGGAGTYTTHFDRDGLPREVVPPSGIAEYRWFYDDLGRLSYAADGESNEMHYETNALGQLEAMRIVPGGDNTAAYYEGRITAYSPSGRVSTVTDSNGARVFSYDPGDGRLSTIEYPDAVAQRFAYYPNGLVSSVSWSDGSEKHFQYDHRKLIACVATHSQPTGCDGVELVRNGLAQVVQEYDRGVLTGDAEYYPNGLLMRVNDLVHDRDPKSGLVTRLERRSPAGSLLGDGLTITHTADGRLQDIIGDRGLVMRRRYYPWGLVAQVETPTTSFDVTPDRDGRPAVVSYSEGGIGHEELFEYRHGRLDLWGSSELGRVQRFTYDAVGNLSTISDVLPSGAEKKVEDYRYDWSSQLVKQITDQGARTYVRDARGNTFDVFLDGVLERKTRHDVWGRLAKVGEHGRGTLLTYDAVDRLLRDESTDGRGRELRHFGVVAARIRDIGDSDWDSLGNHLAIGKPLARFGTFETLVAADLFGVTRGVFASDGSQDEHPVRGPWGELESGSDSLIPFGHKGYYEHNDSPLQWAYARSYDPTSRHFTGPDPLGGNPFLPRTMNRNRSFSAEPIGITDAFGLKDCWGPFCPPEIGITNKPDSPPKDPFDWKPLGGGLAAVVTVGGVALALYGANIIKTDELRAVQDAWDSTVVDLAGASLGSSVPGWEQVAPYLLSGGTVEGPRGRDIVFDPLGGGVSQGARGGDIVSDPLGGGVSQDIITQAARQSTIEDIYGVNLCWPGSVGLLR